GTWCRARWAATACRSACASVSATPSRTAVSSPPWMPAMPAPDVGAAEAATWLAHRGQPLRGNLAIPGDKSISHRAIMLSALADGASRIEGFLEGEDTRATAAIFSAMGVGIEAPAPGVRVVHGVGIDGLRAPSGVLDCGNAGTAMRLLAGLLAGQPFDTTLAGDESLSRRPMGRVIDPLASMGARIDAEGGRAPLHIHGGRALRGIDY